MVQGVASESEQMEPTKAFDMFDGGVMGRLVDYLSALIVCIGGDRCELKTLAIVGQGLVLRVARATLLRVASWTDVDTGGVAAIRRVIRSHTGAMLTNICGDIGP